MIIMFKKKTKAVTLTEILVAVVMLAVCGLPIFGLLNFSTKGTREQSAEAEAGNLAKEEMNRLMYVVDYNELLINTTHDVPCKFAEGKDKVIRKGNEFKGIYCIYPHENSKVKFKIPKMKFHNPQECASNGENHPNVVESLPEEITLDKLYPNVKDPMLVDIYLEVSWKLPSEKEYSDKNKLVLYGRRYHCFE